MEEAEAAAKRARHEGLKLVGRDGRRRGARPLAPKVREPHLERVARDRRDRKAAALEQPRKREVKVVELDQPLGGAENWRIWFTQPAAPAAWSFRRSTGPNVDARTRAQPAASRSRLARDSHAQPQHRSVCLK